MRRVTYTVDGGTGKGFVTTSLKAIEQHYGWVDWQREPMTGKWVRWMLDEFFPAADEGEPLCIGSAQGIFNITARYTTK